MYYAIAIIIVLIAALLLMRLRVRVRVDNRDRLVFVGLGSSGVDIDWLGNFGIVRILGLKIKTFPLQKEKPAVPPSVTPSEGEEVGKEPEAKAQAVPPEKPRSERFRSKRDVLGVVRASLRPTRKYLLGLVRSLIVEQFEGEVIGGFDSPDLTGRAYGYYQAVTGAVPALAGRFRYYPDWTGASFSGAFRASVALPMYRLVYRTIRYTFSLPLRKIIKLAIGTKKGDQDV